MTPTHTASNRRLLLGVVVAAVTICLGALLPQLGTADVSQGERDFGIRYQTTLHGGFAYASDTSLECNLSQTDCDDARHGIGPVLDNNNFNMVWADTDSDGSTHNSTSGVLTIPAGATVERAFLYWGADLNSAQGNTFGSPSDANLYDRVLLASPAAGYTTVFEDHIDRLTNFALDNRDRYQAVADVTDIVSAGGAGNYTVGNIQTAQGDFSYAGWGLFVVYEQASDPLRQLTIFDAYQNVNLTSSPVTATIDGFRTPSSGPVSGEMGMMIWEGDRENDQDRVRFNGTSLDDGVTAIDNVMNSSMVQLGTRYNAKTPDYQNNFGIDLDTFDVSAELTNNQTSGTFQFSTAGNPDTDIYLPGVVTTQIDTFAPELTLTKSVEDVDGGDVDRGDVLRYTIDGTNLGPDIADNVILSDTIPANSDYVANSLNITSGANSGTKTDDAGDGQGTYYSSFDAVSFGLGTGADGTTGGSLGVGESFQVQFDVAVESGIPSGSEIRNYATSTYEGNATGVTFNATSNEVVNTVSANGPNLTIDSRARPASPAAVAASTRSSSPTPASRTPAPR